MYTCPKFRNFMYLSYYDCTLQIPNLLQNNLCCVNVFVALLVDNNLLLKVLITFKDDPCGIILRYHALKLPSHEIV